ncbi:MAG: DUF3833 domain-containing protein [Pseudomonadota bacterium]|nr:DUF3833 domain-containing protein [Pseudomonadota bacterium]
MTKILLLAATLLLGACGATGIDQYTGTQPTLDLREFFDGELIAYGMLQDRRGRMTRRFTATLQGSWQGDTGTLVEHFVFDDGEEQDRTWTLQHLGGGRYTGTAGDVIGTANGSTGGSVFRWNYQLDVPWRDGSIAVTLDDWLYLVDERHLLNRTAMTKFGFRVGELTLVIVKE